MSDLPNVHRMVVFCMPATVAILVTLGILMGFPNMASLVSGPTSLDGFWSLFNYILFITVAQLQ